MPGPVTPTPPDLAGSAPRPGPRRHHVLLAAFAGGTLGTALRAAVTVAIPHSEAQWPWSTLLVNVVGALVIGWLSVRLPRLTDVDPRWHPFLATGFCGGLTTFSTLQLELVALPPVVAVAYLVASIVLGLLAVAIGRRAAHHLEPVS